MNEIGRYESYKKKLEGICDENDFVFRLKTNCYPVTLSIRPVGGVEEQMSLLASADEKYMSPDAALVFSVRDGVVEHQMYGRIVISDVLFTKIKNLFKNIHTCWMQYFFRYCIENDALKSGRMPVIDESASPEDSELESVPDDELEAAEPEEVSDEETISADEFLFNEAVKIVRAENKCTTTLLQRRLNIGFSKAGTLLEMLEEKGIVGAYNGGEGREVLPWDVPDDEATE